MTVSTTMSNEPKKPSMPGQPGQSAAMTGWGDLLETSAGRLAEALSRIKYVVLVLFSITYVIETCYFASRKLFWFDELFTVYMSRLPDFASTWRAVLSGTDFNPPLLYELTRFSELLFGEGHIAARLPGIIGFGVFCLCLFRFVSIRSSALGGFISMLFPLVTGAYWYAYEARSYGVVLGFGGVALICWQGAAMQLERRWYWLAGLAGALACAMLTHTYAVMLVVSPIVIGELARTVSFRRVDWPIWVAIMVASAAILPSVTLVRSVLLTAGSVEFFDATLFKVAKAYQLYLAPAAGVFLGALVLLLAPQTTRPSNVSLATHVGKHQSYEIVALFVFVLIPVFAYLTSKLTGAPFVSRYGISCVAGFAGLLGIAIARRPAIAVGVLFILVAQIGFSFLQFARSISILEPSSSFWLSTYTPHFMQRYTMMTRVPDKAMPIVLLDMLEFLPIFYYAPESLAPRLTYLVDPKAEEIGLLYLKLQKCCRAPGNVSNLPDLLSSHVRFLVYGGPRSAYMLKYFIDAGATLTVEHMSRDDFLVSVTLARKESSTPAVR